MTNISVNDFAVLITYLCFLVETTENLEIQHTFSGCDKAGYSILLQIIWKHGDGFFKIIPVMSDFNQVLCLQKTTYINVKFALDQANGSQLQVSQNPILIACRKNRTWSVLQHINSGLTQITVMSLANISLLL